MDEERKTFTWTAVVCIYVAWILNVTYGAHDAEGLNDPSHKTVLLTMIFQ